jgi:hypothetical protein
MMFCKEGGTVLVSLQSDKRAGGARNPLSLTEGDWEGPIYPFLRNDILLKVIISFPGTSTVSRFVK